MLREILNTLRLRLLALARRKDLDRDLEDELAFHLALREEQEREAGHDPVHARSAARRRFGNALALKEACREPWTFGPLERRLQDAGYALRMLRREPGFALTAVVTLALGIGATTAVSSLLNDGLLRPLPVREPERLFVPHWVAKVDGVRAGTPISGCGEPGDCALPFPLYEKLSESASLEGMAAFSIVSRVQLSVGEETRFASARFVSGNFLSLLGVRAGQGRLLTEDDDTSGAEAAVVLSHDLWRRRFVADPTVVGRTVRVGGASLRVVGVAPPGFAGIDPAERPDLWIPLHSVTSLEMSPTRLTTDVLLHPEAAVLGTVARLAPGVSPERARTELGRRFGELVRGGLSPIYDAEAGTDVVLASVARGLNRLRSDYAKPLALVDRLVWLALAVACANIACLLLARALRRRREIAVRVALGAGRGRLLAQLLTEGLVLAVLGTVGGLALGAWGTRLLALGFDPGLGPGDLARAWPSSSLLISASAVVVAATLLFALAPGALAWRVSAATDLQPARSLGAGWSRSAGWFGRLSRAVVAAEVAGCCILLVGAGLFARTLARYASYDPGFRTDHLLTVAVEPVIGKPAGGAGAADIAAAGERLSGLPGVESATWASLPLVGGGGRMGPVWIGPRSQGPSEMASLFAVGPRFFRTMGIAILAGEDVSAVDAKAPAVWINESFVARCCSRGDPLGRPLNVSGRGESFVAGVVEDTYTCLGWLCKSAQPTVFVPARDEARHLMLRTTAVPLSLADTVRATLREAAPRLLVGSVQDLAGQVAGQTKDQRLLAAASVGLGGLTLLLAAVGLFGVLAYSVSRRGGEIAIRMSLGARRADVVRLVAAEGSRVVFVGMAVGVVGAWWTARSFAHYLFGVGVLDPGSYMLAGSALLLVCAVATIFPARRATQVDPAVALRTE